MRSDTPACAHSGKESAVPCERRARPGHILCEPCRIECGGYNRYTSMPDEQSSVTAQQQLKEQQ